MKSLLLGVLVPGTIIACWEVAMDLSAATPESIVPPSQIAVSLLDLIRDGTLGLATWQTLQSALIGLALGGGFGTLVGVLFGLCARLADLFEVPYEFLRPIPSVALIPLSLLAFGFGLHMEVAVVAFATFWPTSIYTTAATREVEPRLIEVGRVLGMNPAHRIWSIVLPCALPRIFVGLRVAAAVALIVAVTVEVAANPRGLGYSMIIAQQTLRPDLAFAFLAAIGVVGWAFNYAILAIQWFLFPTMAFANWQVRDDG